MWYMLKAGMSDCTVRCVFVWEKSWWSHGRKEFYCVSGCRVMFTRCFCFKFLLKLLVYPLSLFTKRVMSKVTSLHFVSLIQIFVVPTIPNPPSNWRKIVKKAQTKFGVSKLTPTTTAPASSLNSQKKTKTTNKKLHNSETTLKNTAHKHYLDSRQDRIVACLPKEKGAKKHSCQTLTHKTLVPSAFYGFNSLHLKRFYLKIRTKNADILAQTVLNLTHKIIF